METTGRNPDAPLIRNLLECHGSFNYYQLLSLFRRVFDHTNGAPVQGAVRVGSDLSAGFAGSEIRKVAARPDDQGVRLTASNFSTAGTMAPLPEPYTEWLRDEVRNGNDGMLAFLDLFTDRIHSIRFNLKAVGESSLGAHHPDGDVALNIADNIMGLPRHDGRLTSCWGSFPRTLRPEAGLWSTRRRSAPVMESILARLFSVPVWIEQFIGGWVRLSRDQIGRLQRGGSSLKGALALGSRVWDPQAGLRLHLGPMRFRLLVHLLPGGKAHARLVRLVRLLTDRELDVEVRIHVDPDSIPERKLISSDKCSRWGIRLSYTSWIGRPSAASRQSVDYRISAFSERGGE